MQMRVPLCDFAVFCKCCYFWVSHEESLYLLRCEVQLRIVRQTWRKRSFFFSFFFHLKTHLESNWSTQTTVHSTETLYNSPLTVTAFWLVPGMCISPPRWKTTQGYAPTPTMTYIGIMQQFEWKWMSLGPRWAVLFFFLFQFFFFIYFFIFFDLQLFS